MSRAKGKAPPRDINYPGKYAPIVRCGCGSARVLLTDLVEKHGGPTIGLRARCVDCGAERDYLKQSTAA